MSRYDEVPLREPTVYVSTRALFIVLNGEVTMDASRATSGQHDLLVAWAEVEVTP